MVSTTRFYPRGYIGTEQGILLVAKLLAPDNWLPAKISQAEVGVWNGLGTIHNAEFLQNHLAFYVPAEIRSANPLTVERFCDYGDALVAIRSALFAGEIVAEFLDESGKAGWILKEGWGGDAALDILRTGVAWLEDGPEREVCVLLREESLRQITPRILGQRSDAVESAALRMNVRTDDAGGKKLSRGGRPEEFDWPKMKEFARHAVSKYGKPERDNKKLPTKEDLVRLIIDDCAERDVHPSAPNVRKRLTQWLDEF